MSYQEIIEKIAETAEKNNSLNDGDYVKNGLLFCGKCNTPKQTEINLMGRIMKPYCLCRCEEEKDRLEKELFEKKQYEIECEQIRDNAFPAYSRYGGNEKNIRHWTFSNQDGSNPKIMFLAQKYAEYFDRNFRKGLGFLFYGNVGTGKSYTAASIVNALADRHYPVLMTTFARIRNEISDSKEKTAYFDNLSRYSLLVVDDLFAESDTEYMKEIIFQVIDERIANGLPLIVTTNLTQKEMNNPPNIRYERILSRIKEKCRPVLFEGTDKRIKTASESVSLMKEITGI